MTEPSVTAQDTSLGSANRPVSVGWSPWRLVVGFGVVSLTADMVYEGARSVYGPLLATLGASATVVESSFSSLLATACAKRV